MVGRLVASYPPGHGGLSTDKVNQIVGALDQRKMAQGRIAPGANRNLITEIRSGSVQWLGSNDVSEKIFSHLYTLAVVANRELEWNFQLRGVAPYLQATQYAANGNQHYSWHMDWGVGPTRQRKIAVVAHLSDEAAFEGGSLQMTTGSRPVNASQVRGSVTVFPAFMLHRVTPVTRGVRLAVVMWVLGPSFQ